MKLSKNKSYQLSMTLIISLFAIVPILIFSGVYIATKFETWKNEAVQDFAPIFTAISEQTKQEMDEMQSKILYLRDNTAIRYYLAKLDRLSPTEGLDFISVMKEAIEPMRIEDGNLSIRWYSRNATRYYGGFCYPMDDFYSSIDDVIAKIRILQMDANQIYWVAQSPESDETQKNGDYLHLFTRLNLLDNADCIIEMSMPVQDIIKNYTSQLPKNCIMGLHMQMDHGDYERVFSSNPEDVEMLQNYWETGISEGYYVHTVPIGNSPDDCFVYFFSEEPINEYIQHKLIEFGYIILLILILIWLCSYFVTCMLTNRITRFIHNINRELDSMLLSPEQMNQSDSTDFLDVERRIYNLVQRTHAYDTKLKQYEVEKNRLELELLQMRFNPHFLYNTLTSISYQTKDANVRKTITTLISYYRIVLSKGRLFIRIEKEIEMIEKYLKVEFFAYNLPNITYDFEIEKTVQDAYIIKHLLQPVVENALIHGIRANGDEGHITIRDWVEDEDVLFEVQDNGIGMTEEKIAKMLCPPEENSMTGGYGIYNVQQRIKTYYGPEYGLHFRSVPKQGTCVTIRIPFQEKPGD